MNESQVWVEIDDSRVRHVWRDREGKEITVSPSFYSGSGVPIDEEDGEDLEFVRTEIC